MFKYKITIQPSSEGKIPKECLLEEISPENFQIRLNALIEDMRNIPGIINLIYVGHEIMISANLDEASIKEKLRHLFSRDYCHIRFVELEDVSA